MMTQNIQTAILHYSAPPVVGGVEAVLSAHAKVFLQEGYPISVIAGRGEKAAMPEGTKFSRIPLMNSQNKQILSINRELEQGIVSEKYYETRDKLKELLENKLKDYDNLIVHNIFTKHFNLPLTDALHTLLDEGKINNCIGWCHDFSWASPHSKPHLHDGHPWDLLRTYRADIQYVVISKKRQQILADILSISINQIQVIYNGIDPKELMGGSPETNALIKRLDLDSSDLIILMPVRVTQAKNIEFAMQVTASMCEGGCNVKMILTGPPDPHDPENLAYFNQLKKLRADLDIENNFRFLYEEGPTPDKPYILEMSMVNDLYRICDLVFLPSHREGFGMPVLEAGFAGKPVFATNIPAVEEIGQEDVYVIDLEDGPLQAANAIHDWAANNTIYQMRVKTRQRFTWLNIFREQIQPLLVSANGN